MSNNCPRTSVTIQAQNGPVISQFFSPQEGGANLLLDDATFSSPYAPYTQKFNVSNNNYNHYYVIRNYPTGLTLVEQYTPNTNSGNLVIFNNGDIVIDSTINLSTDASLTIISCGGNITVNQSITVSNNLTLVALEGKITFNANHQSDGTSASILTLLAQTIINYSNNNGLSASDEILLSGTVINNGTIVVGQNGTILTQHTIGGNVVGQQVIPPNNAQETLTIEKLTTTFYETPPSPKTIPGNSDGVTLNSGILQIVTRNNLTLAIDPSLSTAGVDLLLITPGTFTLNSALTLNSQNVTILANQINTNGHTIDVSGGSDSKSPGGSITLISMTNIAADHLLANAATIRNGKSCSDSPGLDGTSDKQNAQSGGDGTIGEYIDFLNGGFVTLIASAGISTKNILARCFSKGGKGGDSSCKGGNGGDSPNAPNAGCWTCDGNTGLPGGIGGNGGNGGDGGDGSRSVGGQIILISSSGQIITSDLSVDVDSSGGDGGDSTANGGHGGKGGDGSASGALEPGALDGSGGQGGNGGNGGNAGKGGDAGQAIGGFILLVSCQSVRTTNISAQVLANGGNGGSAENNMGGNAGKGGKGGGDDGAWGGSGSDGIGGNGGNGGNGNSVDGGVIALISCDSVTTNNISVKTEFHNGTGGLSGSDNTYISSDGASGSNGLVEAVFVVSCDSISTSDFSINIERPLSICVNATSDVSVNINSSDSVTVSVYWLENQFGPNFSLTSSDITGDYPLYTTFTVTNDPNVIGVIAQFVAVESIDILDLNPPTTMLAGTTSDISFLVNAQNGSGTACVALSSGSQIVQSDLVLTAGGNGKIFWGGAEPATFYIADFNPQLSDEPHEVKPIILSKLQQNEIPSISSFYIDLSDQIIYISSYKNSAIYYGNIDVKTQKNIKNIKNIQWLSPPPPPSPYGLFFDTIHRQIYVTDTEINIIYTIALSDQQISPIPTILISDLNQPTGLTVDTVHGKIYWTTQGDNTLWVGTIDNISDPTVVNSVIPLLSDNNVINQPTGVFVNPSDKTIYWVNSVNNGELWKGTLNSLTNPTSISDSILLKSDNFGTQEYPVNILSGLFILFDPIPQQSISITAPLQPSDYVYSLAVYDSDLTSCKQESDFIISVIGISFSDINVPTSILAGSALPISFNADIQNSGSTYNAFVRFSDFSSNFNDQPITSGIALSIPSISCGGTHTLTLKIQDVQFPENTVSSDFVITIKPLTVTAQASPSTVQLGQPVNLSVSDSVSDVSYAWTSSPNTTIQGFDTPNATSIPTVATTYTVTATNGQCKVTSFVPVAIRSISLSNISVPSTVLAGSYFSVTFGAAIQNGGTSFNASGIFNNTPFSLGTSDSPITHSFQAPCTGTSTLTLTVQDAQSPSNILSSDFTIQVIPITVNAGSDLTNYPNTVVNLGTGTPQTGVSYSWNSNPSDSTLHASDQLNATASPAVTTTYTVIAQSGACAVSDTIKVTVHSCSITLSNISATSPILAGSDITVTCTPTITNGGSTAVVIASINGTAVSDTTPTGSPITLYNIPAPCTSQNLIITAYDAGKSDCATSDVIPIAVQPLSVQVTPTTSYITQGQLVSISVSDPIPGVTYNWSTGENNINNITVSDEGTYTVTALSGLCTASDSSTVTIKKHCVTLSDVVFSAKGSTHFLSISGYQFSSVPGARTIQLSIGGNTIDIWTFDSDGEFESDLESVTVNQNNTPITLTAFVSDNPGCIPTSNTVTGNEILTLPHHSLTVKYVGSLLRLVFHLPPDLSSTIHTSDINLIFSDMCAFASQKHCGRFVAGFEILEHSDVFPLTAEVLNGHHMVYIFCSDSSLHVHEIFGAFTFITDMFASDSVIIRHNEPSVGTITKTMHRTGHEFSIFDDKILWASPCDSDAPVVRMRNIIDLPLLSVDANFSPVTHIDAVTCIPVCDTLTSDAQYVCHLCKCAQNLDRYLTQHYPNYPDLHPDHCRITYTGDIIANVISIDLDSCMICFSDFLIPDCSDTICF